MNLTTIEEKIVAATIDCINEDGIQATTNRRIAERAGVNSAAINYYFRSKEILIERCLRTTLENAFDYAGFADLPGDTARERCTAIFEHLIAGSIRYAGITRAHFYGIVAEGEYAPLLVEKVNRFVLDLSADLSQRGLQLDPGEMRLACLQITSAALFACLAPRLFAGPARLDITQAEPRRQFIERLVDRLLSAASESRKDNGYE